jgi:FtsP/CotA-like multicopper oxidase with cupredoxin domain
MDHGDQGHAGVDHASMGHGDQGHGGMDHDATHSANDAHQMHRSGMPPAADHGGHGDDLLGLKGQVTHNHRRGPGVANVVDMPFDRLDEPGQGLEDVDHRVLRYSQLRSLAVNPDTRQPGRVLELHLTGNMERYMWSFDGVKYSEVTGPIHFRYGERLRLVLVNDTMMSHPIHLHGMFVELVNGHGPRKPRKHTVVVKPAERLAVDVTADEPGHWAFHCHMLYHMKAGMMRSVMVSDEQTGS